MKKLILFITIPTLVTYGVIKINEVDARNQIEDQKDYTQKITNSQKSPMILGTLPDGRQIKGVYIWEGDVSAGRGYPKLLYIVDHADVNYDVQKGKFTEQETTSTK